jgi:hypothetical protein
MTVRNSLPGQQRENIATFNNDGHKSATNLAEFPLYLQRDGDR